MTTFLDKYEMCEMTGSWLVIKDVIILDFKRASVHVSTSRPSSEKEDCFKQIHRDYLLPRWKKKIQSDSSEEHYQSLLLF